MVVKLGNSSISKCYLVASTVNKIYHGATQAYSSVPSIPFTSDSNTIWWDFRSTQTNNVVNTLGDDTLAYVYDAISGTQGRGLHQPNKSAQPLVKANGIDFNLDTNRSLLMINPTGICNATSGWYCAFNIKASTLGTSLMRISGASTSTTPSRGYIDFGGGGSTVPQIRVNLANNDGTTLTRIGATQVGAIPNLATPTWITVEVQVDISNGTAVLSAWVNGSAQTIASPSTPTHTSTFLASDPNYFVVGNVNSGVTASDSFDGEIQQMIFYNGVPSGGIRSSISSYINGVRP